jgi:hypothetical protein
MVLLLAFGFMSLQQPSLTAQRPDTVVFSGEVERGQSFTYTFHDTLVFKLNPIDNGWELLIHTVGRRDENIARLTPPFHFVPNPRYIEGWHFRNEFNTGPNDGSVNAPDTVREFIFSPKVGTSIDYPISVEQLEQIKREGSGTLTIMHLELGNLVPSKHAYISRMKFRVQMFVSF